MEFGWCTPKKSSKVPTVILNTAQSPLGYQKPRTAFVFNSLLQVADETPPTREALSARVGLTALTHRGGTKSIRVGHLRPQQDTLLRSESLPKLLIRINISLSI